ncbi:hypothetical protein ASG25_16960 [Rhizobium sp. Leaf384]|uniref:hypothetical protein n=1 Tax=unclassified Rhizobium TaxID=2613769 RepID=UPI000715A4C1|nr:MULTISPECIES: hypothetical protein [unclassified Rhizobium]KQR69293.1 hypothetical protein ASG03_08925 [Rhizobium sp. Leaf341]KQS77068.1 hypothetical protein ASG25_16960 [Rhizobium sp. Leaf384]KQS78339.1 hypothetical protein ASG58_08175 [Rhizobium sp. Leaf383]
MTDHAKPAAETDAKGAFKRPTIGRDNNGVTSAKPTVLTGSDDSTINTGPGGERREGKDFDMNYNERDASAGDPGKAS